MNNLQWTHLNKKYKTISKQHRYIIHKISHSTVTVLNRIILDSKRSVECIGPIQWCAFFVCTFLCIIEKVIRSST